MTIRPADFGGDHFEVRRNGVVIPPTSPKHGSPIIGGGLGFGGGVLSLPHEPKNTQRLPLHLLYRFDRSGIYEVRHVGYDFRVPSEKHIRVESPWIQIDVRSTPPAKLQAWLDAMRSAPPDDAGDWLSDYLPSLLATPDAAVLPLLKDAVYHSNDLVRQYTLYALYLFDDSLLADWIPATIKASGPTPDLAYLLSWRRDLFQPYGNDVVRDVLPYLKSTSPLLCAGALQTLDFLKQYDWKTHPTIPGLLDQAVAREAERWSVRTTP